MNEILDSALKYAERGWLVFPLHGFVAGKCTCRVDDCPDAGKHPVTRRGWKDASKDPEVIRAWFEVDPYNIGIATGELSGITVIDIDVGKKAGDSTWALLNKEAGEPQTLMARTGSGGLHVYFQYNSVLKSSTNTLGEGVDCRNDGGYVVAPPSAHRSGKFYEWLDPDQAIVALPAHLTGKRKQEDKKKHRKKSYKLEDVAGMLSKIPADDRDLWRHVGIILGREFDRSPEAWDVYQAWSDTWAGEKGRNHDKIMHEAFDEISQEDGDLSLGTIIKLALENGWAPSSSDSIPIENFLYFAPGNNYIYLPSRQFWIASSVDASCAPQNEEGELIKASDYLKLHKLITSMTSDPGIDGEVKRGWDCLEGILVPSTGGALFNAYRKPIIELGDSRKAQPWLDHVHKVFPAEGDAEQFINYMAHRVQFPGRKPRFALVLVGQQGVGKDTAIQFCVPAIGEWNVESIDPDAVSAGFNEHAAKVLIVVSEASNTQEMSKWTFNEKMKVLIAGTPDYMVINPKYGHKYSVRLHCGVIITTNHLNGLYIPPDDRRYDVIHAPTRVEMFGSEDPSIRAEYFGRLWNWYLQENGASHIAAYLMQRDLRKWDPATAQRITHAHAEIVAGGFDVDSWAMDAVHRLGDPAVVTFTQLVECVEADPKAQMTPKDVKARLGHVMPRIGFSRLVNPNAKDGRWKIEDKWMAVFYKPEKISKADAVTFVTNGKAARQVF